MSVIRYKNPTEYSFLVWINNFPESFHPMDMSRFYTFAKSVSRYNSKNWLKFQYFETKVLEHTSNFEADNIELFHNKLCELFDFYKSNPTPLITINNDNRSGAYQRGVINGRKYEVPISNLEYYGKGASKETLKKAEFF
ncbi:hypothetical protein A3F37_04270 [Candidatus Saccharibacteria bacterium RIFCSPHIGHO2_12_FULL_41_12]|nr:MAG: hypothetical protein A3F37_04270 [Candidatus Saccharibacteria bacterium RIFCSPHIGHO2_12_FULL_41_12]